MSLVAAPHLEASTPQTGALEPRVQLHALLHHAGTAPLDRVGWIGVTGSDRVRWLNGMVTNSLQQLQPGEGNYNFFLSAQGRIQGDAFAFVQPDRILLQTARGRVEALIALLDHFVIMDDVELHALTQDGSGFEQGILCAGPNAAKVLETIGISPDALGSHPEAIGIDSSLSETVTLRSVSWTTLQINLPFYLIHARSPLVPRFELWGSASAIAELTGALYRAGATPVTAEAVDHLRLLEGTPLYGVDIRDRELPQETGQTHALHFNKGCYLGQEIVERIRSRGQVHRTLQAFTLTGDLPAAGTALSLDGKPVGELTSIAAIPLDAGALPLGLGYIRREALDAAARGSSIEYAGGAAAPAAMPYRTP